VTRLELRVAQSVRIGQRYRLQGSVDSCNALTPSSILAITVAYGSRRRLPTLILEPRILQFSAQPTF
jgi:hypothetical protein